MNIGTLRLKDIVWTAALVATAIILTAVLSTATLGATGAAGAEASAEQETEAQAPVAPRFLSQTGLYANAAALKVDPRNRLFSAQHPLWSDGTIKRRWVRLPVGSQINVADLEQWEMPVGTKFWKEFSIGGRKIETRFLWKVRDGQWVVATYTWNDSQTSAVLASETAVSDIAEVVDGRRAALGR